MRFLLSKETGLSNASIKDYKQFIFIAVSHMIVWRGQCNSLLLVQRACNELASTIDWHWARVNCHITLKGILNFFFLCYTKDEIDCRISKFPHTKLWLQKTCNILWKSNWLLLLCCCSLWQLLVTIHFHFICLCVALKKVIPVGNDVKTNIYRQNIIFWQTISLN